MKAPTVPVQAKQGAEVPGIPGMEASIWAERMVTALVNGVEGGQWYSLMDKVYAPKTLTLAWAKVRDRRGAAGVDGQSVERFEAQAERYLAELGQALREGRYRPEAVKRVAIPKGNGLSPLLANLYLHPLDERLMARGYRMVRYADDFVVLCATREEAEAALALIREWVAANGLTLHPDKTRVGDCRQPGEGFEFLGTGSSPGNAGCGSRASSGSRTAFGRRRGVRGATA